ncbi:zinc finger protein 674 [Dendroctonus ponderosae]|uniref:C2H2-type domain-containing protein n=1 Tax=Dendroctonus ponderosae TaxID=77166 RepID=A0AAR5PZD3_DENPD|nr:zinc finger protein 674 [Dendroctonus ponderosae]
MDSESFTRTEVDCLQGLIDGIQNDELIKDDQIKDSDIIFFSQFGHLDDDPNFQILDAAADGGASTTANIQEMIPSNLESSSAAPSKKDSSLIFSKTKYKEQDGKCSRVFQCGVCGKEFGHQYTLMRHLPTHTDERKFHCLTCGKSFRQMSTLSQHRAIHSSARPYVCRVCNKNFNRVSTLISHSKTHTGVKPHRCHICDKAFHQKGNLRNHIFTHTNERPYKCDICENGFNQMSNLMCHKLKAHQQQTEVPRYTCQICGQEFLKRNNLRTHEQFKHGLAPSDEPPNRASDHSSAILVNPIKTDAMKKAMLAGATPFALLRPLSGIPVLVRVLPAGEKQMLVPATAEDLKTFGHISIKPKVADSNSTELADKEISGGCIVQIKVPVVATVIQAIAGLSGDVSTNVVSPGPGEILDSRNLDLNADSFVYASSLPDKSGPGLAHSFAFDDKMLGGEEKTLDGSSAALANSMEFTFEIPQDARADLIYPFTGSAAPQKVSQS